MKLWEVVSIVVTGRAALVIDRLTDWMIDLKLYVILGRSESIYKTVSGTFRLIVLNRLPSFCSSTSAGNDILLVLSFNHASVQLISSRVKFT